MSRRIHWCDLLIGVAGLWLLAAPTVLGFDLHEFPHSPTAALNCYVVGSGMAAFSLMSAWRLQDNGNEMLNIGFGTWLMLAPYALGFADWLTPTINGLLTGLTVVALAALDVRLTIRPRVRKSDASTAGGAFRPR
jgi:hypothetical protein